METITKNIPALALRGLTVFPRMTASFDVEREISVRALERAMETGQEIFLVTQRELGVELPEEKDLYEVGTVARVIQILRASNSMMRVVMEGGSRARLRRLWQREPFLQAQVELIGEEKSPRHGTRTEAMLWNPLQKRFWTALHSAGFKRCQLGKLKTYFVTATLGLQTIQKTIMTGSKQPSNICREMRARLFLRIWWISICFTAIATMWKAMRKRWNTLMHVCLN